MVPPIGTASTAWSVRLLAELDAADEKANELVIGLNPEQPNWQPGPGAWSVGQCLEHLCITNEVICRPFRVHWRANRSLPFRTSYRGGSVDGSLTVTSSHPLRASTPERQERLCQARESNFPFWIVFYAVTKPPADSFVALVITM
jgi:hypothetical protein